MEEPKKRGRPSKQNNVLTKNAFEKKEEVPLVALDMPAADKQQRTAPKEEVKEVHIIPKEVPPTAPNTPVAHIDMPKPKKERSAGQIEATKRMLEANKLKKGAKKEIIIKEDVKVEAKEDLQKTINELKSKVILLETPKPEPKESKPKPKPKPKPSPKEKEKKEKKVKYVSSSEEESESDSSSEEKYIQKATRKMALVNSIEARLKQNAIPKTKYSNLSIFS
jgi:hypothetical protein